MSYIDKISNASLFTIDCADIAITWMFERGDEYKVTAPLTNIVVIALKIIKGLGVYLLRISTGISIVSSARCISYLNKKQYKVSFILLIPYWGHQYYMKNPVSQIAVKQVDNSIITLPPVMPSRHRNTFQQIKYSHINLPEVTQKTSAPINPESNQFNFSNLSIKEILNLASNFLNSGKYTEENLIQIFFTPLFEGYKRENFTFFLDSLRENDQFLADCIGDNLKKFITIDWWNHLTIDESLCFFEEFIRKRNRKAVQNLRECFPYFNMTKLFYVLTQKEKIKFIEKLAKINKQLVLNFRYNYIKLSKYDLKDKIELCRAICQNSGSAARIADMYYDLGFNKEFTKICKIEHKVALYKELLLFGQEMAVPLCHSFEYYFKTNEYNHENFEGIDCLDLKSRQDFFEFIAEHSRGNLIFDPLDDFSFKRRITLLKKIIDSSSEVITSLSYRLHYFKSWKEDEVADIEDILSLIRFSFHKSSLGSTFARLCFEYWNSHFNLIDRLPEKQYFHICLELSLLPSPAGHPNLKETKKSLKFNEDKYQNTADILAPFLDDKLSFDNDHLEIFKKFISSNNIDCLLPFFEKIQTLKESKIILMKWLAYTTGIMWEDKSYDLENTKQFLGLVYQYRSPQYRFYLTRQFFTVKKLLGNASQKESPKARMAEDFSRLLISRWVENGLDEKLGLLLHNKIITLSFNFKDAKCLEQLLFFLENAVESSFGAEDREMRYNILIYILHNNKKELYQQLSALKLIKDFFGIARWRSCIERYLGNNVEQNKIPFNLMFIEEFESCFSIHLANVEAVQLEKVFSKFRKPTAIYTFIVSMKGDVNMLKVLSEYINAVVKQDFSLERYRTDEHPHLRMVFEAKPSLKDVWMTRKKFEHFQNYDIGTTDDPEDLLLLTTEINSCLNIYNGSNVVCLIGYFWGDVLPVVIKSDGIIVARSLLRLMLDKESKMPVLFQERIYGNLKEEVMKKMSQTALDFAKEMGVPLLTKEISVKKSQKYPTAIEYKGGRAFSVYSDAAGRYDDKESFKIEDCIEILEV